MRHPRRFVREAFADLRASLPIARSLLAQRLRQRYRHSSLGFLWAIVPAAFVSVVMTIGRKARFPLMDTGPIPPQVYGLYGIVMMQSFLEALNAERMAISGNRQLLSRQRIPLEGMILAGAGEMLVSLSMKLVAVGFVCLLLSAPPAPTLPLGLLAIAQVAVLGVALGVAMAPWNAMSRDLDHVMLFLPWVLFATTPIFIRPQHGSGLARVFALNPLAWLVDNARAYACTGRGSLSLLLGATAALTLLLGGAWLLTRLCLPYALERSTD
ncbi:MAG: ABC transporter permease [Armatimonadetes bacterium]|nr:ABC transporter permease [Armatimonadota bacterium]